jgi:hypothetical protein
MAGSNDDLGRSKRLGAEDQGWSNTDQELGGQRIGRSSDVVCNLHHAQGDEERRFLSLALKPRSCGFPSLGLKTDRSSLVIWAIKSTQRFLGLRLKIKRATVCQLHHKTNGRRTARDTC